MKIIKTIYNNKTKWETIKATLQDNEGNWVNGLNTAMELSFLPKPPADDWEPDPNNPEDNGWTNFQSYAVDLYTEDTFDIMSNGLDMYLAPIPKDILRFMHRVPSTVDYALEFKYPDLSWTKDDLIRLCEKYNISYIQSWTKQHIIDEISNTTFYN